MWLSLKSLGIINGTFYCRQLHRLVPLLAVCLSRLKTFNVLGGDLGSRNESGSGQVAFTIRIFEAAAAAAAAST